MGSSVSEEYNMDVELFHFEYGLIISNTYRTSLLTQKWECRPKVTAGIVYQISSIWEVSDAKVSVSIHIECSIFNFFFFMAAAHIMCHFMFKFPFMRQNSHAMEEVFICT